MADNIPIFPSGGSGGGSKNSGSSSKSGGGNKAKGGKKGSGSRGVSTGSAALNRQIRSQKSQNRSQRKNLLSQARLLNAQARSLRKALSSKGFRRALDTRLANIAQDLRQQDKLLMEGYKARVGSLTGAADDNEAAAGDQSFANLSNRARERSNAISQALSQGAGESDLLRSEQMSLRNWDANQNEINRGFHDTLRSINSSLTDLNVDTKTGRSNLYLQANEDRETAYTNYYNQASETWTNLGNTYGQLANTYGQANVFGADRNSGAYAKGKDAKGMKAAEKRAKAAFNRASKIAGKAYKDPGIPSKIMGWQGDAPIEGQLSNSVYIEDAEVEERKKPEGATLRKWE